MVAAPAKSPVTAYAEAVIRGDVVVSKYVRLAAERHLRDLKTGHLRGLEFRDKRAQAAIGFFRVLRLPDGSGAGGPFILQPWQEFVVGSLFGWYAGERRRFHYSLVEVARANGKSPLAAGIGLFALILDGEMGAQVYSAATTRDQAKIVFNDAVRMVEKSSIAPQVLKTVNNLAFMQGNSYFRPLAAEASTMDGLRVHVALVDELHEHPNGEVMAKLRTGMKSTQPLLFAITTAGYDRNTVCYEEHDHAVKVLEGVIENDAYFAFIACLDEDDDWQDESCWPKANPSLGVTVRLDTLREECELAKQIPGQQNSFKRLRLNVWTEQSTRWLDMDLWDENAGELTHDQMKEALKGRKCFGGGDLSSRVDLTSVSLWFPNEDGSVDTLTFPFIPEDNMQDRIRRDRVPYDVWVEQGFIDATPGNVIDYDWIRKKFNDLADDYVIEEIALDPWNATQLMIKLGEDGFTCVPIRQGFQSLTEPTKELEKLVVSRKLRHGGHPVLRWAASNVAVSTDPAGNIKPDKAKSTERIDPIAALINAGARAVVHGDDEQTAGVFFV